MNSGESRKPFAIQLRILVATKWYLNYIDLRTNLISLSLSIWAMKEKEVLQPTNSLKKGTITFSFCLEVSNNLMKSFINSSKAEMFPNQKDKSLKKSKRRKRIKANRLEQDNSKRKWINSEENILFPFFFALKK